MLEEQYQQFHGNDSKGWHNTVRPFKTIKDSIDKHESHSKAQNVCQLIPSNETSGGLIMLMNADGTGHFIQ